MAAGLRGAVLISAAFCRGMGAACRGAVRDFSAGGRGAALGEEGLYDELNKHEIPNRRQHSAFLGGGFTVRPALGHTA